MRASVVPELPSVATSTESCISGFSCDRAQIVPGSRDTARGCPTDGVTVDSVSVVQCITVLTIICQQEYFCQSLRINFYTMQGSTQPDDTRAELYVRSLLPDGHTQQQAAVIDRIKQ